MTDLELTQAGQIKYLRERLESERQARITAELRCEGVRKDAEMLARLCEEQRKKIEDAQSALLEVFDQVPMDIVWMLKNKQKRTRWMIAAGQSEPPCCDSKPVPPVREAIAPCYNCPGAPTDSSCSECVKQPLKGKP